MDAISRTFTDQRFTAVHGNFRYLENYCDYLGISGRIDGILADLGCRRTTSTMPRAASHSAPTALSTCA